MKRSIILLLIVTLSGYSIQAQDWKIREGHEIRFAGTKAEGTFEGLKGTIRFDPQDLSNASFDVSVDVSTISTGNKTKDKHARGESWFFAEEFPQIFFKSSQIRKTSTGYEVLGELDLRGVKKEVALPFTFSDQGSKAQFTGALSLNREDYGIMGNFFGFMVGEDFEVTINVPVAK